MREHLALVEENLTNTILCRISLGLQAVKPSRLVRLPGLEQQCSESLDGPCVARTLVNKPLQFVLLGGPITLAFRQPRTKRMNI